MRRKVESIYLEGGGAYLGQEANLLGQIHQLDEISLGPLWSGDTLSIPYLSPPPPNHMARGRWTAVLGERPPWGWAPGIGSSRARDFNPTGQRFQSAFSESPHRKNFKQIQVLCFSAQGPINQLPERSGRERKKRQQRSPTPWLSLILLGQGEPECEAAGWSAPCFKLTLRAERLLFFFFLHCFFSSSTLQTDCKMANARVQTSGRNHVLPPLTAPSFQQTWHLKMGKIMISIKIAGATNCDISLPTEATNNLSCMAFSPTASRHF